MEIRIGQKTYKLPWEYFIAPLLILLIIILLIITNHSRIKETWIDFTEKPGSFNEGEISKVDYVENYGIEHINEENSAEQGHSKGVNEIDGKININEAGLQELVSLPYIGEVKAKAIIEYRESKGRFSDIEELLNVKGIGRKTLERIRPHIAVD